MMNMGDGHQITGCTWLILYLIFLVSCHCSAQDDVDSPGLIHTSLGETVRLTWNFTSPVVNFAIYSGQHTQQPTSRPVFSSSQCPIGNPDRLTWTCVRIGVTVGIDIRNVCDDDAGSYTIAYRNDRKRYDSDAVIYVVKPPSTPVISGPDVINWNNLQVAAFKNHATTTLTCTADIQSLPAAHRQNSQLRYSWTRHAPVPITHSNGSVTVGPLNAEQDGTVMTCEASDGSKTSSSDVILRLKSPLRGTYTNLDSTRQKLARLGQQARVEISMSGFPLYPENITWVFHRAGQPSAGPLPKGVETVLEQNVASLYIGSVEKQHYGRYVFTADNGFSASRMHFDLVHNGPPEPPTNLTASGKSGRIRFTWRAGFSGSAQTFWLKVFQGTSTNLPDPPLQTRSHGPGNFTEGQTIVETLPLQLNQNYTVKLTAENEHGVVDGQTYFVIGKSDAQQQALKQEIKKGSNRARKPEVTYSDKKAIIRYNIIVNASSANITSVFIKHCVASKPGVCKNDSTKRLNTVEKPLEIQLVDPNEIKFTFDFKILRGETEIDRFTIDLVKKLFETVKTQQILIYVVGAVLVSFIIIMAFCYFKKKPKGKLSALAALAERDHHPDHVKCDPPFVDDCRRPSSVYEKLDDFDDLDGYDVPEILKFREPAVCPSGPAVPKLPPMRPEPEANRNEDYSNPDEDMRVLAAKIATKMASVRSQIPPKIAQTQPAPTNAANYLAVLDDDQPTYQNQNNNDCSPKDAQTEGRTYLAMLDDEDPIGIDQYMTTDVEDGYEDPSKTPTPALDGFSCETGYLTTTTEDENAYLVDVNARNVHQNARNLHQNARNLHQNARNLHVHQNEGPKEQDDQQYMALNKANSECNIYTRM